MRMLKAGEALFSKHRVMILVFAAGALLSLYLRYRITPALSADYISLLTYAGDSAAYLRLFDLAVVGFPAMPPGIDYYSNFPWGLEHFLPAVWPYLLAAVSLPLAWMLGLEPAQAAGLVMMVLSAAIALPVYFLSRELFGRAVGVAASFIALFHLDFALLGPTGLDHHVADVFLVASVYASFFVARGALSRRDLRRFLVAAFAGGAMTALSLLISLSLILIIGVVVVPVALAVFLLSQDEFESVAGSFAAMFGVAAAVLAIAALTTPWFSATLALSRLSLLHILLLGGMAAGTGALYIISKRASGKRSTRGIALGAMVAIGGALIVLPGFSEALYAGYLRSIGSYPLGIMTTELEPLLAQGLETPVKYFSPLFVITPLTIGALIMRNIRRRELTFEHLFVYSVGAVLTKYTFEALYYSIYLSIFLVITYGLGVTWTAHELSKRIRTARSAQRLKEMLTVVGVALVVAAMLPGALSKQSLRTDPNLVRLAEFMRASTPAGGDFAVPEKQPAYGVLVDWSRSYQLQYLAQCATVSTGNTDAGGRGIAAAARFFQSESEDKAYALAEQLNARYVVVGEMPFIFEGDTARLTESLRNPETVAYAVTTDRIEPERLHRIMGVRMFWDVIMPDEAATKEPLRHFRLIYVSAASLEKAPFMLYERVKGARVSVRATPCAPVEIHTRVSSDVGVAFEWRDAGVADAAGRFWTTAPYATGRGSGGLAVAPYQVRAGEKSLTLEVDESAVETGRELAVETEQ